MNIGNLDHVTDNLNSLQLDNRPSNRPDPFSGAQAPSARPVPPPRPTFPRERSSAEDTEAADRWATRIMEAKKEVEDARAAVEKKRAEIAAKKAAIMDAIKKKRLATLKSLTDSYRQSLTADLPTDRKAETLNALAWIQATNPVPELSNGTQSLDHARQAVALAPQSPAYLATLAAALARTGDFAEAARVQQQALDLTDASDQYGGPPAPLLPGGARWRGARGSSSGSICIAKGSR
jgi:tetratricopeptide (TPR) repeat protein